MRVKWGWRDERMRDCRKEEKIAINKETGNKKKESRRKKHSLLYTFGVTIKSHMLVVKISAAPHTFS
jgi:hypothetical protein